MATNTLPNTDGIETSRDGWREALGLTEHPDPGHVFGKTALTQQEWRHLAHLHAGRRFVVLYESPNMMRLASSPKTLAAAWADLRTGLWTSASAYSKPGYRITVMAVDDFESARKGGRP
jgi:hypothetical protein